MDFLKNSELILTKILNSRKEESAVWTSPVKVSSTIDVDVPASWSSQPDAELLMFPSAIASATIALQLALCAAS